MKVQQTLPILSVRRHFFIVSVVLVLSAGVGKTLGQGEPSREPVLRIETGMHTAPIRGIGVDRTGKFLVTGSDDKTARVWDLQTGRLLRVLRVPIGDGDEGKLYAATISPDGNTVAVGGWTGYEWDKQHGVYLFDRDSGRLTRRLATGLPHRVYHLAFSPDGALLVANTNGMHVWRTSDWTEVGRDTAYDDKSFSADFDHAGRLVTSCDDGSLRLYDRAMRLLLKHEAPGGKQPNVVRFSPNGRKVAVGYWDSTRVDVLSGDTLGLLYSADTLDIRNGDMSSVAWSMDGTMLYAGGSYQNGGSHIIRRWSNAGRGQYVDMPAADNKIYDIAPLPTGGVVYGTADPSWGILDSQYKQTPTYRTGQIADYRQLLKSFLTDAHAGAIGFAYEYGGKWPAVFQLSDRTLEPDAPAASDMRPPRTEAPGLSVTDWEDTFAPRLNNTPLKLKHNEASRSLALAPDGQRFLLGTEWYIRLFSVSGQELWPKSVPAPGIAWSVNISGDGRLALAAYGDGTIRWYRMSDGKELLAFFPHADRKRWILWTPSGYYDASPGAEELIGWHVNNGRDAAADFFPVGQFRDRFYRPDVVARVLTTLDEQLALKQANEERGLKQQQMSIAALLPPVVDIISPAEGAPISPGQITVRYRLRSLTNEPVTSIMAMVDGRTVKVESGLSLNPGSDGQERETKVEVGPGASLLSILAINRNAPSVAATVRISIKPASRGTEEVETEQPAADKPTLYVLAVGVGEYLKTSGLPRLTYPAKDAKDFAAALESQKGRHYQDVKEMILPDATHDQIMDGLEWIAKNTTGKDVAMIFFAGHGITDGGRFYYFMPADSELEHPKKRGVPFAEIENTIISLKGRKILFVDTCRSGAVLGERGFIDINGIANDLNQATAGVAVFTASGGKDNAEESSSWGNGAFTRALLDGIRGEADFFHSGEITFSMLDLFITRRVHELTGNRQHPSATKPVTVPDFLVAALR